MCGSPYVDRLALFRLHCTLITLNCPPELVRRTIDAQIRLWAVGLKGLNITIFSDLGVPMSY